jgi:mRNA-degrading endonuclease RelE of RelBE toxin-antitoxin system
MRHLTSTSFWECYEKLSPTIQKLAEKSFDILKDNIHHPSLHCKKIEHYWSVRIGSKYRALAVEVDEGLLWFWIGTHAEYDRLIKQ